METESLPPERESRLERITRRIAELERQRRKLQAQSNRRERKARTRRLIQIGAITVKYLNLPDSIEPVEFEQEIRKALGLQ